MCKMHGFTDALRLRKMTNCEQFVELKKFIFALDGRAHATKSYAELITVVSHRKFSIQLVSVVKDFEGYVA